jgi:hypothetical protein
MDSQFIASPHTAAGALTRVATGTALKTLAASRCPRGPALSTSSAGAARSVASPPLTRPASST